MSGNPLNGNHKRIYFLDAMKTVTSDGILTLDAPELRRRSAIIANRLRQYVFVIMLFKVLNSKLFFRCIDVSKRVLLEKFQDTQCDAAGKLSQSIYVVESLLGKCHQESDLLFFTIRQDPPVILFASTSYVPMLIKRYMVPGKLTYPY